MKKTFAALTFAIALATSSSHLMAQTDTATQDKKMDKGKSGDTMSGDHMSDGKMSDGKMSDDHMDSKMSHKKKGKKKTSDSMSTMTH